MRTETREGAHCSAGKNLEIYGITREEAEQKTRRQRRHRRQRDKKRQIWPGDLKAFLKGDTFVLDLNQEERIEVKARAGDSGKAHVWVWRGPKTHWAVHVCPVLLSILINATTEHLASFIQQILMEPILGARHVLDKSLVKQWMRSSWKGPRLILKGGGGSYSHQHIW